MRRAALGFVVTALLALAPLASPAGAGETCCICSECASGPAECFLPPISCDITCGQAGCIGFSLGGGEACNVLSSCGSAAPITAPAPAAGRVGVAGLGALLAALGLYRLSRRRA